MTNKQPQQQYEIGVIGLGVMGRNPLLNMAWRLLMPVLDVWAMAPPGDFPNYTAGTWGPEAAQNLFAHQGHSWPLPTESVCPAGTPSEDHDPGGGWAPLKGCR